MHVGYYRASSLICAVMLPLILPARNSVAIAVSMDKRILTLHSYIVLYPTFVSFTKFHHKTTFTGGGGVAIGAHFRADGSTACTLYLQIMKETIHDVSLTGAGF